MKLYLTIRPLQILVLILFSILFLSAIKNDAVIKESIIDTKWFIKEQDSIAIYFKHDNTFWIYRYNTQQVDSFSVCRWDLLHDKIYLSGTLEVDSTSGLPILPETHRMSVLTSVGPVTKTSPSSYRFSQSFKILFLNNTNMTVSSPASNKSIEYTNSF